MANDRPQCGDCDHYVPGHEGRGSCRGKLPEARPVIQLRWVSADEDGKEKKLEATSTKTSPAYYPGVWATDDCCAAHQRFEAWRVKRHRTIAKPAKADPPKQDEDCPF